ncbi:hypothetical protein B0H14DRAFT_3150718 [Mycena olivaceomarginata]|nr:hypothetical protein B0H14DRAFT_3150718 [Mycena olivaceomarginata]
MTLALTTASASFFATVIGSFFYGLFFILVILSTALHIQRIMRNHPSTSRGATNALCSAKSHDYGGLHVVSHRHRESDNPQVYFIAPIRPRAVTGVGFFLASLVTCDAMIVGPDTSHGTSYSLFLDISSLDRVEQVYASCDLPSSHSTWNDRCHAPTDHYDCRRKPVFNGTASWIVTDSVFNLLFVIFSPSTSVVKLTRVCRTNIYSTGLIAYRIHKINTLASSAGLTRVNGGEDLKSVMAILVESSALLSTWIVFEMITYATKSPLEGFVLVTLGTVSGISFMLINVRVALGWGQINRTTIRMETQEDMHVDMPANDDSDNGYELDAVSKDQI